ncbi:UNVERIFIED_CONTAM: hypothetical protein PYX00_011528 [Menopon gallinae]|uniref:Uncharacterized protein n=1 Tax=Menopon gallinae TaxID=328185 RepID=A0AAW2H7W0_9NEOP
MASGQNTDAVVVAYGRTPIGKASRGSFRNLTSDALLSPVIKTVLQRAHTGPETVEECVFGNALSPSGGFMETRMAALECGIPVDTPLMVVNRWCGSGLDALDNVASKIRSGRISVGLAGGFELMSRNTMPLEPCIEADSLRSEHARRCLMTMGETSEELAMRFGISRDDSDRYACQSQERALHATESGEWDGEIVPVRTEGDVVCRDDGVRRSDMATLSRLKPVFREGGISTAGNSSQLSDAAAAVLLMSREKAAALGVPVLGTFVDFVCVGCDPSVMGIGPSVAIPRLLRRNNLTAGDVDVFEINEAFASQTLYCIRALGIPESKRRDLRVGVVSLCVGTGMGVAALIRRD